MQLLEGDIKLNIYLHIKASLIYVCTIQNVFTVSYLESQVLHMM